MSDTSDCKHEWRPWAMGGGIALICAKCGKGRRVNLILPADTARDTKH